MTRWFRFLFWGSFPDMAVSVFSPHSDPGRWVRGVGRVRGSPDSQSVPDVFCRARRDWLAMTSCCSSGWGQRCRGRLLQRQRGRSDDGDRSCRGDVGPKQWRRESQGSSLTIFTCPCARWGPRLGLCEILGRWRGRGDTISPLTFVTASGQDGAGSPWGAGGEARPPPPQRMWPGCIPVGLGADPGWAGEGKGLGRRRLWCGRCRRPEEEEMTVWGRVPSPTQPNSCGSRGKTLEGHCWWGVTAAGGGEGLAPYFLICFSPCKVSLCKVAGP